MNGVVACVCAGGSYSPRSASDAAPPLPPPPPPPPAAEGSPMRCDMASASVLTNTHRPQKRAQQPHDKKRKTGRMMTKVVNVPAWSRHTSKMAMKVNGSVPMNVDRYVELIMPPTARCMSDSGSSSPPAASPTRPCQRGGQEGTGKEVR